MPKGRAGYDVAGRQGLTAHDLQSFADEGPQLAALIGAPASSLPTYGRTEDSARPHIEFDGGRFHYVIVERGQELERPSSADPQEVLYWVFESVTQRMATDYEGRHRRTGDDSRRQWFEVQLELLGRLSADWRRRRMRARLDEVLRARAGGKNGGNEPSRRFDFRNCRRRTGGSVAPYPFRTIRPPGGPVTRPGRAAYRGPTPAARRPKHLTVARTSGTFH